MTNMSVSNTVQALDCTSLSYGRKPAHMKATKKKYYGPFTLENRNQEVHEIDNTRSAVLS